MNQIDFLPASFLQRQERNTRLLRHGLIVGLLMLALGGAHWMLQQRTERLTDQAAYMEQEAQALSIQIEESARLNRQRTELIRRLRLQQELMPPMTPSQLLALIGEALPESSNLVSLSLTDTTPTMPSKPTGTSGAEGGDEQGRGVSSGATGRPRSTMQISLVGLAPSDVEVANFFGGLVELPVFENGKLLYSRPTRIGPLLAREFRVELEAPLDRRIVPSQKVRGQGVADAN